MSATVVVKEDELSRHGLLILKMASIAMLLMALFGRALGPSDLWDHTQTRTVSYTTDMIVNGGLHWVLPIERGEKPATKPPMYNWIAAPMVMWLGFNNEIAHRFPSIAAMCICWLVIVRLGNAIDNRPTPVMGWLAALAFVANYSTFKLGFLARPDMLLNMWLLLGWIAATRLLINADGLSRWSRMNMVAGFWLCVLLAAMTKGPAALVLPAYGLVAARMLYGSWRSIAPLRMELGVPAVLAVMGTWLWILWRINPDHVTQKLIFEEVIGRVTGVGEEGNHDGPLGLVIDLPLPAGYFLLRFLPWSIPAIGAMWLMLRSRRNSGNPWIIGAAAFTLTVVGLFSLSAGKRAEYIAGAMPACAILAAWWLQNEWKRLGTRQPWLMPLAGVITLASCIWYDFTENGAPHRGFGVGIRTFIDRSSECMAAEPLSGGLVFCWTGETQVQAMLGSSQIDGKNAVFAAIEKGQPFWLVAGRKTSEPNEFAQWLRTRKPGVSAEPLIESPSMARDQGWPEQMTLYRVTP